MDFHQMKRKQLQSLCKKHGIPANLKNVEMADRLSSILKGNQTEGVEEPSSADLVEIGHETSMKDLPPRAKKVRFSPDNETFVFIISDTESPMKKKRPVRRSYRKKLKNSSLAAEDSQVIEDAPAEAQKLKSAKNDKKTKKESSDTVPGDDSTELSLDLDPARKELPPRRSRRKGVMSRLLSDEEFSVGKIAYATQLLEPVIKDKPGSKSNPSKGSSVMSKKTISKGANIKQKRGSRRGSADVIAAPESENSIARLESSNLNPDLGGSEVEFNKAVTDGIQEKVEARRGSADVIAAPESENSMARLESSNLNPDLGGSEVEFNKAVTNGIQEKVEARPGKKVSPMDHDAQNTEETFAALELDKFPVTGCMDSNTVSSEGNKMEELLLGTSEDNPNEVGSRHKDNLGTTGEVVPYERASPMTSPCGDSHVPFQLEEGGSGTEPVNQEQENSWETVEAGDCLSPASISPVRASGPNFLSQESVLEGQEEELQRNANSGINSLEVVKETEKSYHLDCNTAAEPSLANPATVFQEINSGLLPAISEFAKGSIDCTEGSGQNSPLLELVRTEQIEELRDDKSSGSDPGDMIKEAEESACDWKSTERTNQCISQSSVFGGEGHPSKDECVDHEKEVCTNVAGEAKSVQDGYPEVRGELVIAELHVIEGANPNGQITEDAKHEASDTDSDNAPMEIPEKLANGCSENNNITMISSPNTIRTATEKSSDPIVPTEDERVYEDEILVSKTEDGRSNEEEMVRDEIEKDNTFDLGRDSLGSVEEWPREEWQNYGTPCFYLGNSGSVCHVEEDKKAIVLISPEDNRVDKSDNASPSAVCQSVANVSCALFSSRGRHITPEDSEHGVCEHDVSVSNNEHVTGYEGKNEEEVLTDEDGIPEGLNFRRESISSGEMRLREDSPAGGMTLSCLRKSALGSEIEKAKDYSESRRRSLQSIASAEERRADEDDHRSADSALQSSCIIREVLFSSREPAFSPKGDAHEDDNDEAHQEHSPDSIKANNASREVAWSAERRNLTTADCNSSISPSEEPKKLCISKMDGGIGFKKEAETGEEAITICSDNDAVTVTASVSPMLLEVEINVGEICEANGVATVCKDFGGISNNSNEEVEMAKCSSEMNINSLEVCGEENVPVEQSSSISPDECPQDKENVSAQYNSSSHTMVNIDIDSKLNFKNEEETCIPGVQMAPTVTEDGKNLENSLPTYEEVAAEEKYIHDEAAIEEQFVGDQVAAPDQYKEDKVAAEEQFIGGEASAQDLRMDDKIAAEFISIRESTPEGQVSLLTKSYSCLQNEITANKASDGNFALVADSSSKRGSETKKLSAIAQVRTSTDCENGTSDCDSQLFTSREVSLVFGEGKTNAAEELLLEADADSMEVATGIPDRSAEKDLAATTMAKYIEQETSEDEHEHEHELPLNGLDSECPQDKENVSAQYNSSSHTMLNIDIDSKLNFENEEETCIPGVQMAPTVTEDGKNLENSLPTYEEVAAEEKYIHDEAAIEEQFVGDQVAAPDQYKEDKVAAEEQFIGGEASAQDLRMDDKIAAEFISIRESTPEGQVSLLTKSYSWLQTETTANMASEGNSALVADSSSKRGSETKKLSAIAQVRTSTDCENGTSDCDSQLFTSREVSLFFGEGKTNAAEELLLEADADSMEVVMGIPDRSVEKDLAATTMAKYIEQETSEDEQVGAEDISKQEKQEVLKPISDVPASATDQLMNEAPEETLEDDEDVSAMIEEYIDRENEGDASVEIENPSLSINKEPSEECDWNILMEESTIVYLVKGAEVLVPGDATEYGERVKQRNEEFNSKYLAPSQSTLKEMNSLETPKKSLHAYDTMKENICENSKRDQLGGNATAGKTTKKGRKALEELQKNLGNNC